MQLKQKLTHADTYANKSSNEIGLHAAYRGQKPGNFHTKELSFEYQTNIYNSLEGDGKGPATTHVWNMQCREEDHTMEWRIKYI